MKRYLYILILFFPIITKAQLPYDSLSFIKTRYSEPLLTSNFEKQLKTFNLKQQFVYGKQTKKLFLGINQKFTSTIIRTNSISVRDNASFSLLGQYDFSPSFSFGSNFNYSLYSDDKRLAINNSSILHSSAYIKYFPQKHISLTPYIGISRNQQIGITDIGAIYGMEALLDNYHFNEFNLFSEFKFQTEDIAPRENQIINLKFRIDKNFQNNYQNRLLGLYSEQRKDFYFDTDSLTQIEFDITKNIQSRTEKKYSIADRLTVLTPINGLVLNLDGNLSWREIERETKFFSTASSSFDTQIEEFRMSLFSSLQYNSSRVNGILRFIISERQEKHKIKNRAEINNITFTNKEEQEKRKNNTGKQLTLSGEGSLDITTKDRITLSLFHRKLVYDTPSELNNDDRDELLSMFGINYYRLISPFFNLFVTLQGSINNTVYIFKERSANNNTLRVLKLISGGDLHLGYLSSKNSAEVSANYTTYNFEDVIPNLKSFSYRQLALKDSTTLKLFRTTYLTFLGYMKFSEQGDFKWDKFANNPVRYLDERYAEPTVEYRFNKFTFAIGLRYFSLYTYLFDGDNRKKIHSTYTSTAPLSSITYSVTNSVDVKIKGWYEFISTELNKHNELANLTIRVNWNI